MDSQELDTYLFSQIRDEALYFNSPTQRLIDHRGDNDWLFDLRRLFMRAEFLEVAASRFWHEYKESYPFQIGGIESASIPLITAITLHARREGYSVNSFYIRKSRKRVGRQRFIEGELDDTPVILIDDLINTGSTFLRQITILAEYNVSVRDVFVFVQFRSNYAYDYLRDFGITLNPLFTAESFGLSLIANKADDNFSPPQWAHVWDARIPHPAEYYLLYTYLPTLITTENDVIACTSRGTGTRLSGNDGSVIWKKEFTYSLGKRSRFSSPLLGSDIDLAFATASDGNLYAFNTKGGSKAWQYSHQECKVFTPTRFSKKQIGVVVKHEAFIGKSNMLILDAYTGKVLSTTELPFMPSVQPLYIAEEKSVVVANEAGSVTLVRISGKKRWQTELAEPVSGGFTYDFSSHTLLCGTENGTLYQLNVRNGTEQTIGKAQFSISGPPALYENLIICASQDKKVHAFSQETGEEQWAFATDGRLFAPPLVLDGIVYQGSNDGGLYAIRASDGVGTRIFQSSERIIHTPCVSESGQYLFVSSLVGIHCLRRQPIDTAF